MKKLLIYITAITLVLLLSLTSAFALNGNHNVNYTDSNSDGICDNSSNGSGKNFTDSNSDGICDNSGNGSGKNFTDSNNDGICDNSGSDDCKGFGICKNKK